MRVGGSEGSEGSAHLADVGVIVATGFVLSIAFSLLVRGYG